MQPPQQAQIQPVRQIGANPPASMTAAAGYVAISGVGRFALLVTPDLTETRLELTPVTDPSAARANNV